MQLHALEQNRHRASSPVSPYETKVTTLGKHNLLGEGTPYK